MKKHILTLCIILLTTLSMFAQNKKDSIIYIFPDNVEQKIYEEIENVNRSTLNGNLKFHFFLELIDKEQFRLFLSFSPMKSNNYWTDNTNRFVLVNNKRYPLMFDYDLRFSTSNPNEIGEYGQREGYISKTIIIHEGYSIIFDRTGTVILEDWGLSSKTEDF